MAASAKGANQVLHQANSAVKFTPYKVDTSFLKVV